MNRVIYVDRTSIPAIHLKCDIGDDIGVLIILLIISSGDG